MVMGVGFGEFVGAGEGEGEGEGGGEAGGVRELIGAEEIYALWGVRWGVRFMGWKEGILCAGDGRWKMSGRGGGEVGVVNLLLCSVRGKDEEDEGVISVRYCVRHVCLNLI